MWVKKFYVRGDDDDDDDEIKTSMILRVHHISSWSCGFDKLSLALQTNHMADNNEWTLRIEKNETEKNET